MVNILVTSGGTMEFIDDVRVISNISTGKLGYKIAESLAKVEGYKIHYVHSKTAVVPSVVDPYLQCYEVRTAQDTFDMMKKIMEENQIHAVVHCMAVSDFTFKRDGAVKLKSNDPEAFIGYMRKTITKNPKIISFIKTWDPRTILIGFKFEVGFSFEQLKEAAVKSIETNGCDLVIANDKEEMVKAQEHIAHFFFSNDIKEQFDITDGTVLGKDDIAWKINYFLNKVLTLTEDL